MFLKILIYFNEHNGGFMYEQNHERQLFFIWVIKRYVEKLILPDFGYDHG